MRLSLLSRCPSTSLGDGPRSSRHSVTKQSRRGTLPSFCSDAGGTPYASEAIVLLTNVSDGLLVDSEFVFESVQSTTLLDMPVPSASSPAVELMKNSVPLLCVANWVPFESAGQTVNPGTTFVPFLLVKFWRFTTFVIWPAASRSFWNAYSCAPLKLLPNFPGRL